ncbi:MAG TPA: hypothetical protein VF240_19710 [Pyrinomonadaceae bacterium]
MNSEASAKTDESAGAASAWQSLRSSPAVRSALYAYVLTRLAVFVVLIVGGHES